MALGAVLVVGHVLRRRRVIVHRRRQGKVPLFSPAIAFDPTSLSYLLPSPSTVIALN